MNKRPLDALTGMRFFAAIYVIGFHFFFLDSRVKDAFLGHLPWPVLSFIDRGATAVSFFFVLSGFILAYNYGSARGEMTASRHDFWLARFARIVPMYLVGLLLATPLYIQAIWYSMPAGHKVWPIGDIAANFGAALFFLNAWLPFHNEVNPPGWTLSAEAFFYAVFPFVVGRLGRMSSRQLLVAATVFYLLSLLPNLIFSAFVPCGTNLYERTTTHNQYVVSLVLYNLPILRLPEFLVGMSLGIAYQRMPASERRGWQTNPVLALGALVAALAFVVAVPWPVLRSSFFVPFEAWAIWALACRPAAGVARALGSMPMVLLGEASYGVYLFHFPLLTFITRRAVLMGFHFTLPVVIGILCVILATVTFISIILFWFVEERARRWLRKRYQRGKLPIHPAASALG